MQARCSPYGILVCLQSSPESLFILNQRVVIADYLKDAEKVLNPNPWLYLGEITGPGLFLQKQADLKRVRGSTSSWHTMICGL